MAFSVCLVLFLALPLKHGLGLFINSSSSNSSNNSELLAILNATNLSVDLLLRIDVMTGENASLTTTETPLSLESIIRAEINRDWERGRLVLDLASMVRTVQLKHAIYEALWLELQQMQQIYNPLKLLDFYTELEQLSDVPPPLLEKVYQALVQSSAQLLSAPFHASSQCAIFPLVTQLLQRLTLSTLDYLKDILEALFNVILALESNLGVVQRLGSFSDNLTQLTQANLQLQQRPELQLDEQAHRALVQNLRTLLEQSTFIEEVEYALQQQVYAQLPEADRILYTAQKVCLRNVSDAYGYIYECPQTYLICTNAHDPRKASYNLQRGHGGLNNSLQFAFYSSYWNNHYIFLEPSNHTAPNAIIKNIYSRDAINWWYAVIQEDGTSVALFDAATNSSVLCGGDQQYWDTGEEHVYTRNAEEFANYRRECVWRIEDCSYIEK
ncbi:uncharacterized protein LOC6558980 [Drosophila grimshawi]|uniref:GH15033 n=1 Tax=Drosophila grimshawi TaxID=7222 RepID=B4IZY9_DROGR|nr:uncharacterized protein LOC6558980 [Drosophila grimshawi]EDV96761.1 GH15033 [Drosophila grimshawi]